MSHMIRLCAIAIVCYESCAMQSRQSLRGNSVQEFGSSSLQNSGDDSKFSLYDSFVTPYFDRDFSFEFMLLVPKYKLMFCFVPKNGCSAFNALINEINGIDEPQRGPWFASSAHKFGWNQSSIEHNLVSNDWTKAVFVRDPMERLVSGYLSKCTPNGEGVVEDGGKHCVGQQDRVAAGDIPALGDLLDVLAEQHRSFEGVQDAHFRNQADFCGGLNLADYDFVGHVDDNVSAQVKDMLGRVGAHQETWRVPKHFPDGGATTFASNELTGAASGTTLKSHLSHVNLIVNAFDTYESDYRRLLPNQKEEVCITGAVALNMEKAHILDWVAYHRLADVRCFILFIHTAQTNMEDGGVKEIWNALASLDGVLLLSIGDVNQRIPNPTVMTKLAKFMKGRFLAPLDVDEYIVQRSLDENFASDWAAPPSLTDFLQRRVAAVGALGVYLHRLDFGTGGFVEPPPESYLPEVMMYSERNPVIGRKGKPIIDLKAGTQYIGVHTWGRPASGGVMLLPNGSTFNCDPRCLCPSNDTTTPDLACLDESTCREDQCNLRKPQAISINHYMTRSLSECYSRTRASQWSRRSMDECDRFHEASGFVRDFTIMPYGTLVRKERLRLFGDAGLRLMRMTEMESLPDSFRDRTRVQLPSDTADTMRFQIDNISSNSTSNVSRLNKGSGGAYNFSGSSDPDIGSSTNSSTIGASSTTTTSNTDTTQVMSDDELGYNATMANLTKSKDATNDEQERVATPLDAPSRGIAIPMNVFRNRSLHLDAGERWKTGGIKWWYNYKLHPPNTSEIDDLSGAEFVPTVHFHDVAAGELERIILDKNTKHIMGFNEPNTLGQGDSLSPDVACVLWREVLSFARANKLRVVAPSVNDCTPASGTSGSSNCGWGAGAWLDKFFSYPGCGIEHVDAIAVHRYSSPDTISNLIDRLHTKYQKPVWLTEFGPGNCTLTFPAALSLELVNKKFSKKPSAVLERYAWGHAASSIAGMCSFFNNDASLTAIGELYSQGLEQKEERLRIEQLKDMSRREYKEASAQPGYGIDVSVTDSPTEVIRKISVVPPMPETSKMIPYVSSSDCACSEGMGQIFEIDSCKAAATSLHVEFKSESSWPNHAKGCVSRPDGVYFNTHPTGECSTWAAAVCSSTS